MQKLEYQDQRHLEAAEGWLGLGNQVEAFEELEQITPQLRVKEKKWEACVHIARAITKLAPSLSHGWIHWAFSLHALKRTKEAKEVLLPVVDKFPKEPIMHYNLACYECQLGNLKESMKWLEKAIDLAGKKDIRLMALNDSDLEPLWREIEEI